MRRLRAGSADHAAVAIARRPYPQARLPHLEALTIVDFEIRSIAPIQEILNLQQREAA